MIGDGVGKSALHVAEKFRFQQRFGNSAAVDGNERLAGARAGLVNSLGQQFLASAAFAAYQHARIGLRHHARFSQHLGHAAGAADDLVLPGFLTAFGRDMRGRAQLQGLRDFVEQSLAIKRLGQVGEHAALGRFNRVGYGAVRRQQNDRHGGMLRTNIVKKR